MSPSRHANAQLSGTNPTSLRRARARRRPPSRDRSRSAVAAERRREHDVGLHPVAGRCRGRPRGRTRARRVPAQPRRRRWPSPIRRKPTPAERASRGGPPSSKPSARRRAAADAANRPTPRASAARPISASTGGFGIVPRRPQERGRPSRGPCRANRADAGRTHGCCAPVTPTARPDDPVAQMPDRRWRWRSDPVRLRRPRGATAPRPWPPQVAATGLGRRRRRRCGARAYELANAPRLSTSHLMPVPAGTGNRLTQNLFG